MRMAEHTLVEKSYLNRGAGPQRHPPLAQLHLSLRGQQAIEDSSKDGLGRTVSCYQHVLHALIIERTRQERQAVVFPQALCPSQ